MLQLVVMYSDDTTRYFPVEIETGWRVDTTHRQLVVGKGLTRTMIPFDTVRYYSIEEYNGTDDI
jgi:hypothetical protein